jgi:hypothetical protein
VIAEAALIDRNAGDPHAGRAALSRLAADLAHLGPPVVVFNAAHSGSRLLAAGLADAGVFMGASLNASLDATPIVPLVHHIVERYVPDFSLLFDAGDARLAAIATEAFTEHLKGRDPAERWGWKLGETIFALPVLATVFPDARFIHIVRDGRDVAFSPFVAPKDAFWRKVHFNTDRIASWHGLSMTQRAYRARGPMFNAVRWVNSVTLGRAYGAMLGPRYREVRYEQLVGDFPGTMAGLLDWLEIPPPTVPATRLEIHRHSVGKWRHQSRRAIDAVCAVLEPTLTCFSYSDGGRVPMFPREPLWRRLLWS